MLDHVFSDRRFGDLQSELKQLTMDTRRTPQWIGPTHSPDEHPNFRIDLRPTHATAFPPPVVPKTLPMPMNKGFWLNDMQRSPPIRPTSRHHNSEKAVRIRESWARVPMIEGSELLPKR